MVKVYYDFKDRDNYAAYLGLIIEHLDKYLTRYKHYYREIKKLCLEKYQELRPESTEISEESIIKLVTNKNYPKEREKYKLIPYYKYMEISDMVNYINLKILNIIGDRTKEAVSYYKFRDKLKKENSDTLGFELDDLSQEVKEALNECNSSRNYLAHIGDSSFISQLNYREEQLKETIELFNSNTSSNLSLDNIRELKKYIISSNRYEYVDVEWIYQVFISYERSLPIFSLLFKQMKKDYAKIAKLENVTVERMQNRVLPFNYSQITIDSVEMQRKRKK